MLQDKAMLTMVDLCWYFTVETAEYISIKLGR